MAVILGVAVAISRHRTKIRWRVIGAGLALQVVTAVLVLVWEPGNKALGLTAGKIAEVIHFADKRSQFVFGPLMGDEKTFIFALHVLPVIIFLGAIIGALYYVRVIQWFIEIVGTALKAIIGTSKIESVWASTLIVLGQR